MNGNAFATSSPKKSAAKKSPLAQKPSKTKINQDVKRIAMLEKREDLIRRRMNPLMYIERSSSVQPSGNRKAAMPFVSHTSSLTLTTDLPFYEMCPGPEDQGSNSEDDCTSCSSSLTSNGSFYDRRDSFDSASAFSTSLQLSPKRSVSSDYLSTSPTKKIKSKNQATPTPPQTPQAPHHVSPPSAMSSMNSSLPSSTSSSSFLSHSATPCALDFVGEDYFSHDFSFLQRETNLFDILCEEDLLQASPRGMVNTLPLTDGIDDGWLRLLDANEGWN